MEYRGSTLFADAFKVIQSDSRQLDWRGHKYIYNTKHSAAFNEVISRIIITTLFKPLMVIIQAQYL